MCRPRARRRRTAGAGRGVAARARARARRAVCGWENAGRGRGKGPAASCLMTTAKGCAAVVAGDGRTWGVGERVSTIRAPPKTKLSGRVVPVPRGRRGPGIAGPRVGSGGAALIGTAPAAS